MRATSLFAVAVWVSVAGLAVAQDKPKWKVHDMERPLPPVVVPAPASGPVAPPSDAIVLFDGKDLSRWTGRGGKPAAWKVENGYAEVNGTGDITTKDAFGSCQLHVEWATPAEVKGDGQGRGNSGVFLMDRYEIQVLDSYNNRTYADGQAASLYGQNPPLVNASRKPGEWQTYDVLFRRPIFKEGQVTRKATVTVVHNGVLVQDHFEIWGASTHARAATYAAHPDKMPIHLQDHGNPVRYRNIWIRELTDE
jgi:hypothetical protein